MVTMNHPVRQNSQVRASPQVIRALNRWAAHTLTFLMVFGPGLIAMKAGNDAGAVDTARTSSGCCSNCYRFPISSRGLVLGERFANNAWNNFVNWVTREGRQIFSVLHPLDDVPRRERGHRASRSDANDQVRLLGFRVLQLAGVIHGLGN